jgi:hydroxymethylpyrimidine pyrophosphatase-like HAD family hydrolase/GT2 family glycosyltransferase/adenine/guanine phosphoribosyltransferase-like PRPP-binding protein
MPTSTLREPTLTVIICAYTMDRWDDLNAAVDSVHAQTRLPEETILVVDHCPQLAERAARQLTGIRITASRGTPGLSGARNTGIAEAHGEIIAFLDDDATADPRWAEHLLAGYRDPNVIGVGGAIRPRWDRPRPAWFPTEFDWVVGCTYTGMPAETGPVRNLLGANMSFRREILDGSGGFRTDLGRVGAKPLGCEETDLCIRASRSHPGGVLLYDPAASVSHHVPNQRATWTYFRARCYAEGQSKAAMTRRTGTARALSAERSYLTRTIPRALRAALPANPATVPALLGGVAITSAGYALSRLRPHPADAPPDAPRPPVPDLHADAAELLHLLHDAAARGDLLDAYLAVCGLDQIIEDRIRGTSTLARRLADHTAADDRGTAGQAALRILDTTTALGLLSPGHRELDHWHRRIQDLSAILAAFDETDDRLDGALAAVGTTVPPHAARLLSGAVLRPPACFRSFDQHPRDIDLLIDRFAARYPDRARPLLILGVRTSGTYLAPLAAARARALGYRDVIVRTIRPGERLMSGETRTLHRILHAGGLALILDDPPSTGRSFARVARAAERAGFPRSRVVLAFAAFEGADTPKHLRGRPAVTLPAADWDIRRRLAPDAIHNLVTALLAADTKILAITDAPPGNPTRLGHLSVPLTVTIATDRGPFELPMTAEGCGLGYLGRHAADVADALNGTVPHVYGIADGILLRERGAAQPASASGPASASASASSAAVRRAVPPDTLADYVIARQNALPLATDRSMLLRGREPAWEIGARLLAATLGRPGTPLRPLLIDPILRQLLHAEHPCIVDGRMLPWLWSSDGEGWHKTDFDEGSFSHLDLASADALFDLAGAAVLAPEAEDKLIARYQQTTGTAISPARWCVLKLVHAWNLQRLQQLGAAAELDTLDPARIQDRAVQQFYHHLYLADLDDEPRGAWCALDLDGTLETDLLGFPTTSPAGALCLRALRAHGYRTLIATGRSIPEVQDRCTHYRLPGAVAEYGAALFNAASGETATLVPEHDGALAAELQALPFTHTDPRYRCCVRAYHRTGRRRTGLPPEIIDDIETRHQVIAVNGDSQTDFLPRGLDKILGIDALTQLIDGTPGTIALAVGDSRSDLATLQAAHLGLAPGNGDRSALGAAGIEILPGHYQRGLTQAVARLLGHAPGNCRTCRPPEPAPAEQALLAILALPEAGRRGTATGLIRVARARRRITRPDGRAS